MAFFSSMVWSRKFMHTRFYLLFGFFFLCFLTAECVSFISVVRRLYTFVCVCVEMIKNNRSPYSRASRCSSGTHCCFHVLILSRGRMPHAYNLCKCTRSQQGRRQMTEWQWGEMESVRASETYDGALFAAALVAAVVFVVDRRRLHRRRAPFSWNSGR